MKLQYFMTDDYQNMSQTSAEIIIDTFKRKPDGLYCFAGGDTPVGTLQLLATAAKNKEIDLTQAKFIELDEWVGLNPENPGSCISYLKRNLFDPIGIREDQVHTFNPLAPNLDTECKLANQFVEKHGGLTLSLLGVGVNGHLGFNEPYSSFDANAHVVDLDETTQNVGGKYFSDKEIDRTKGITLGIRQLLSSSTLIVQASGKKKKQAIQQVLSGEVTAEWPVTSIWLHSNPILIVDKEAVK
ncbi:glucosamine-6-phosphate deaminase [Enterococcus sp. RIT-PI-f]|jgi:glucosamine-6-phosphate deaminase|uniref:glucosamine-6-phosphate deaminase n=1 Tax=Enterococcus sp. RIT-PI-f TaxID=1690244 RepID=UPI0006B995FE|nr:glucosamine-6-phosphate deaminase [Enterococcus sp. RIT-PI-f]KPG71536.1 glucosamine-6-phosphate deaminase [Enterococcus sp. RIT-PI-f]